MSHDGSGICAECPATRAPEDPDKTDSRPTGERTLTAAAPTIHRRTRVEGRQPANALVLAEFERAATLSKPGTHQFLGVSRCIRAPADKP